MKIQKLTALALALALLFALAACGAPAATDAPVEATEAPAEPTAAPVAAAEEAAEAVTVRLAALTGPTAMGMAKIFSDARRRHGGEQLRIRALRRGGRADAAASAGWRGHRRGAAQSCERTL